MTYYHAAFLDSSVGKEATCNSGGPGSIPGLRRSAGEGWATHSSILGLPRWLIWQRIRPQYSRPRFDPWGVKIPWRRRRERKGYPLQYSCASLVAQLVKNLPAMQETWVQSLGWEGPLEKGKATHFSILAWRIPWTSTGVSNSRTQLSSLSLKRKEDIKSQKDILLSGKENCHSFNI